MWQEGTAKLISIIQKLQLHRETGQLRVIRGEGMASENGIIVFTNGKVVETRVGRRTGSDAFNRLSNWENCLCQFVRATDKSGEPRPYVFDKIVERFTDEAANAAPPAPSYAFPQRIESDTRKTNDPYANRLTISAIPLHIVQLQVAFHKIEQLRLSRSHRQLFLLIDGQRSIADLIRLTTKKEDEIYMILHDLEHAILIKFIPLT